MYIPVRFPLLGCSHSRLLELYRFLSVKNMKTWIYRRVQVKQIDNSWKKTLYQLDGRTAISATGVKSVNYKSQRRPPQREHEF